MPIVKYIPIHKSPLRLLQYMTREGKTEDTLVSGIYCSDNMEKNPYLHGVGFIVKNYGITNFRAVIKRNLEKCKSKTTVYSFAQQLSLYCQNIVIATHI